MSKRRQWILWSVGAAMLVVIAWFVWFIVSTPRMLRDCYGQWDTATLVIWFHEQNNRLPANWDELKQVYGEGDGLRGGLKFEQIKDTIVVEFARLVELEKLAWSTSRPSTLPEIVYPKSGRQSHWAGAEPNELIYDYLRENRQKKADP